MEGYVEIKLDISKMKGRKNMTPVEQLHKTLIKMFGKDTADVLYLNIYVTNQSHHTFERNCREWARKYTHYNKHTIDKCVGMEMLCYSLPVLDRKIKGAKNSLGYLSIDKLLDGAISLAKNRNNSIQGNCEQSRGICE